jgi:hypothetical protein
MNSTFHALWPLLSGSGAAALPPVLVPRAPLPPWDPDATDPETGAHLPVYTTLREEPPAKADVRWWRGDAWGITLPGLPLVPGGATSGGAMDRVLTYFLDRYDRHSGGGHVWEELILEQHRRNGYTHISISPQDSFADGMSVDDYVAMAQRCRKAGLFVHHLLRSKYFTDLTAPNLDDVNALVERLLAVDAAQVFTPAWECNVWSPAIVRAMIDHDAALIGTRAILYLHFLPHYISWQANDETPTDFWKANYGKVDGVLYQCDPAWTAGMMAARITDGLDRLGPGGLWGLGLSGRPDPVTGQEHAIDYVVWETVATMQYSNAHDGDGRVSDEDTGNLKGFECLGAPGQLVARGYGNGGRRPDGTAL